jgi:hypothetical protein
MQIKNTEHKNTLLRFLDFEICSFETLTTQFWTLKLIRYRSVIINDLYVN